MPRFTNDHIHLRSKDPDGLVRYFHQVFGASIIQSVQSDGQPRIDLDLDGLHIFIAKVPAEANLPGTPADPHLGLDHFGLMVDNLDTTVADLRSRGAEIYMEPRTIRPGVKIAFVRAPEHIRIELLQRDKPAWQEV
jgi:lactoylglutathione lyase